MRNIYLLALGICANFSAANAQVIYYQDFDHVGGPTAGGAGTYSFAPGFLLRNVDNRTPAANVAYVNEAWERREDFQNNVADSVAFATSWYAPPGASDDWMWTPLIGPLPANAQLSWNAKSYDPLYLEGYEVRVMVSPTAPTGGTGAIGNQITNSTVVYSGTEPATWAGHTVPLNAYAGQSVYIGFRDISTDKFLVVVDDIKVEVILNYEAQLLSVDTVTEYTEIPQTQTAPLVLGGTVRNNGAMAMTNVTVTANVFNETNNLMYSASSTPIASLASGATSHVTIPGWTPPANTQNYTVKLFVDATETDQLNTNDTISQTVVITENEYARDNGVVTGSLGIGDGNGGYLGQDYLVINSGRVASIKAYYTHGYTGERLAAAIWSMTPAGVPDQIIATTDTLIYPDDSADFYQLPIHGGPFVLNPGRYAVTGIEFDSTLALAQTSAFFTGNRTWVNWPTSPFGGWAHNEAFGAGFAKSYVIRPQFLPLCPASVITSSSTTNAACGLSDGEANLVVPAGNYTYDWSTGDTTQNITGLAANTYTVTVTNTDLQCSQVVTLTVNNVNGPTLVSIDGSSVNCFGDLGTASVQVSGGTAPFTYLWSNGGITATITTNAGSYNVTVTDSNGCVLNAGPTNILSPTELTSAATSNPESCEGCNDGTASVNATGGTPNYTYAWAPSGGTGATASGLTGGVYTVTVTDANGCTSSATVTVSTTSHAAIAENNVADGINTYPNPSDGVFVVTSNIDYSGKAQVEIIDATGKVVYSQPVVLNSTLTNTSIHLNYTAAGTYMLRLTAGKQQFFRRLMIK